MQGTVHRVEVKRSVMDYPFLDNQALNEHAPAMGRSQAVRRWTPSGLAALAIAGLWGLGAWQPLERLAYNQVFQLRGGAAWDSRVVVVTVDDRSVSRLGQSSGRRSAYAQLIHRLTAAQPNVVAMHLPLDEASPADAELAQAIQHHRQIVLSQDWDRAGNVRSPVAPLRKAAQAVAPVAMPAEEDGMVRHVPLRMDEQPSLGLAVWQAYAQDHPTAPLPSTDRPIWLNWSSLAQIPQYSLSQVVSGQVSADAFRHKIVLVGLTATKMDEMLTPLDRNPPANGVHLHATLVSNLLQQSYLRPVSPECLLGVLLACVGLSGLVAGWRMRYQLVVMLGLAVGWCAVAVLLLSAAILLPIVPPLALIGSTMLLMMVERYGMMKSANQVLHHQSHYDGLTQVANRRYFDRYLQTEWQRHIRDRAPLALLLCDVDYFKLYNDTYGHLAGDECLQQVARVMAETIKRPADLVARYGGEEFAIVLPNTPLMGAVRLAEDLRRNLKALHLPHASSLTTDHVTISIGVTSVVPVRQLSPERLLVAADAALYQAKQQGRDQACIHWVTLSLPQAPNPFS